MTMQESNQTTGPDTAAELTRLAGWKQCTKCRQVKAADDFHRMRSSPDGRRPDCRDCQNGYQQRHPRAHTKATRERSRQRTRRYRAARPEEARKSVRNYRAKVRAAVFEHYGRTCACCGSTKRPTIDHIGGGGGEHRTEIGTSAISLYLWLVKNGFPVGFQTLCAPCNASKGNSGHCRLSHEAAR